MAPFGLEDGEPAMPVHNWVERADGARQELSATETAAMAAGGVFVIETPGGGGYGKPRKVI